jgi:hypothetical protein
MKALGVLESKWDLIRRKLVRCFLEEQDKVLRSYFAQREGMRRNGRSIYLLSLSVLKLSQKVCIVEAWVEGGGETDVPEGRGGAEVEAWRRL